ncbi:MAG TPA: RNA-binding protein [Fluviicola sp.]|nr:RNA-binding protein [Fluviicola sp.]
MTSIFVAKLDFNTTDEELKSLFERHGRVNRVTIAKDRETGKPRGFAFVEMPNEQEAEAAIEALDNASVNGRTIAVKKADDRGSKPAGGGSNDRPQRPDFRPNNDRPAGDRPTFNKRTDEVPPMRPGFDSDDVIPDVLPLKTDRTSNKKDKSKDSFASKDKPKQHKLEPYKKSGKANRFFDDDDDDDGDWNRSRRQSSGWDDEEE